MAGSAAMTLGLMGNLGKSNFRELLPSLLEELRRREVRFVLESEAARGFDLAPGESLPAREIPGAADLVFSFGGDGTLLRTARTVGASGVPILGINLGPGLGYLTELGVNELGENLDRILSGDFQVEQRMRLAAEAPGSTKDVSALNDIVIRPQQVSRVHSIQVNIDGSPLTEYRADGLIISTPTGSTAYSLAATGPIVEPKLHTIILAPICPHTLTMRPIVIADKRTIEIRSTSDSFLVADGEIVEEVQPDFVVTVTRAPYATHLANISGRDFYHTLRAKLRWGSRDIPEDPS